MRPELGGARRPSSSPVGHAGPLGALPPRHLPQCSAPGNRQVTTPDSRLPTLNSQLSTLYSRFSMPLRSVTPPFSLQVHGLFYGWPGVCVVVEESHQPGQAAGQGKQLQGVSTFFFLPYLTRKRLLAASVVDFNPRKADQEKVGLQPPSYP